VLVPTADLLFHFVRLPGDGGDGAADVEGGGGGGELAGADDDHFAGGGALDGEGTGDHLGIELEELHRVLRRAGAADGGVGNQRVARFVLLVEADGDGLLAERADGDD